MPIRQFFTAKIREGKTSILNAFRWVLYGEAESKGKRLTYADILNLKPPMKVRQKFMSK